MGKEGIVVAVVKLEETEKYVAKPELTSRGFVFEGYGGVLDEAAIDLDRIFKVRKLQNASIIKKSYKSIFGKIFL